MYSLYTCIAIATSLSVHVCVLSFLNLLLSTDIVVVLRVEWDFEKCRLLTSNSAFNLCTETAFD